MSFKHLLALLAMFATFPIGTPADARQDVPKIGYDEQHVQRWNAFVAKLYALHLQQLSGIDVRTKKTIGGYYRYPNFYDEVEYIDAANGRTLSKIQWQRNLGGVPDAGLAPEKAVERIHNIEVYVHDDQGRVIRDYSATYLPDFRNAPIQTLISLHGYNGALHGFRVFDASGDRIFEVCRDAAHGNKEVVSFDEDQIDGARRDPHSAMYGDDYKACFGSIPKTADAYLSPH